jgi:CheY-like chemotaxis protein
VRTIAILEDDPARQQEFARVAKSLGANVSFHDNAAAFQAWIKTELSSLSLISLDGDLFGSSNPDPGNGLEVAQYLSSISPSSIPVIVHSVNRGLARQMVEVLHLAKWKVIRVDPVPGDDLDVPLDPTQWISQTWQKSVSSILESRSK